MTVKCLNEFEGLEENPIKVSDEKVREKKNSSVMENDKKHCEMGGVVNTFSDTSENDSPIVNRLLKEIHELKNLTLLEAKQVLNLREACLFTGLSKSVLYKKCFYKQIPYYKAVNGKFLYFNRDDLTAYMLANRVSTSEELSEVATNYCLTGKISGTKVRQRTGSTSSKNVKQSKLPNHA